VVEQHHLGTALCCSRGNFIGLAAAGKKARVGPGTAALDQANAFQPGGLRQTLELLRAFCVIRGVEIERNEQRAFAARGTFKQGELP